MTCFIFQFGLYAIFFSAFILIRIGTIISWSFDNDDAYQGFRGVNYITMTFLGTLSGQTDAIVSFVDIGRTLSRDHLETE